MKRFLLTLGAIAIALLLMLPLGVYVQAAGSFPPGTYSTTISASDVPAAFPKDVAAALVGTWDDQLTADGSNTVSENGKVVVQGSWTSAGDQLTITDQSGDLACTTPPGQETGTYKWAFDGKALTLTPTNDQCDGRKFILTVHSLLLKQAQASPVMPQTGGTDASIYPWLLALGSLAALGGLDLRRRYRHSAQG